MAVFALSSLSLKQTYVLLNYSKSLYPAIILGIFLGCFVTFSVINSPNDGDKITIQSMRGPGGRPLPTRRRSNNQIQDSVAIRDFSPRAKIAFVVLTSAVILTFVISGIATLFRILTYRDDQWWPGQSAIVSFSPTSKIHC